MVIFFVALVGVGVWFWIAHRHGWPAAASRGRAAEVPTLWRPTMAAPTMAFASARRVLALRLPGPDPAPRRVL